MSTVYVPYEVLPVVVRVFESRVHSFRGRPIEDEMRTLVLFRTLQLVAEASHGSDKADTESGHAPLVPSVEPLVPSTRVRRAVRK